MSALPSFILFCGSSLLSEEKIRDHQNQLEKSFPRQLHRIVYDAEETPLDQILREARTLPFLCHAQTMIVRNADALNKADVECLAGYLESPNPHTYLWLQAEKLDKDAPLLKLAAGPGQLVQFEDDQKKFAGIKLIKDKLRAAGKTIEPSVMEELESQAGDTPELMASVLDNMILYSGESPVISRDVFDRMDENLEQNNIYQFTNAVFAKKSEPAVYFLHRLIEQGEEVISIVGMLHWNLRRLWKVRVLLDRGLPMNMAAKEAGLSPKQLPFVQRQIALFNRGQLEKLIEGLFHIDWNSKTGRLSDTVAGLERWIAGLGN